MHTFAIVLASLPALVLGQADSLGLPSPTTLTSLASPPSVPAIPSLTGFRVVRRTEATPCPTTTTAAGLLNILRRDEAGKNDADTLPTAAETLPETAVLEKVNALSSGPGVKRGQIFRNRDLGLPILPGVLGASSSEAAPSTTRAADSEVTSATNHTVSPPVAESGTAHNATIDANSTSTLTSYPSPMATQTEFRFDSAAVNGPPPTSASATAQSSQTLAARAESTSSKNSTSGLDTDSKYVCSADIIITNSTTTSNTTETAATGTASTAAADATQTVKTAYHCYLRHPNATTTSTQMATGTGTTLLTVTTKQADLTNAEVSQTITDTFSVTSLASHPASTEAAATTTSADAVGGLLSPLTGVLRF